LYRTERIFVVTALLVVGLALVIAMNQGILGGGMEQLGLLLWLMGLSLVILSAVGALWVVPQEGVAAANRPGRVYLPVLRLPAVTIVPALMAVGAIFFVQLFESALFQGLLALLAGSAFAVLFWAQVHTLNAGDRFFALGQSVLNIGSHLTAFFLFSAIYGAKVRSLFSASAVTLVTALLLFELLSRDAAWHRAMGLPVEGRRTTVGLLSLAGGLVAGELTWGLNYWAALSTLLGGAFLLVVFYVIHGLTSHYLDRTLSRSLVIEYGVVAAVGLAAVFASAFFV
jgi:hypothetical protein